MDTMNNRLLPLLERLLSLLVVFLLLSGTVVWSGKYFGQRLASPATATHPVTAAAFPTSDQLAQLGLDATQLVQADSASWAVISPDGKADGTLLATDPYSHDVSGFVGPTPLYIYIDSHDTVRGIVSGDNAESADFYRRAEDGLFGQVCGKSLADVASKKLDAVTGATYSSNAIIHNLKYTLAARSQATGSGVHRAPAIGWGRTALFLAVLAFGIAVAWHWRGVKWLRLLVMGLNVVVVGFWCGQYLSVALLRGWIQNGVDPLLYLPTVAMLLVAIAMTLAGRRHTHHYCQWLCPYGSLQELAWHIPLPKLRVKPHIYKILRLTRYAILLVLLACLWFGFGTSVLDYEPFSFFNLSAAAPAVIVLAAAFVVLGIFMPHPWCRAVCPLGTLLELAADGSHSTPPADKPHDAKSRTTP